MKFYENLRNLRKEKDYSQEYLAERMNVSRQTISKWENGTAMPDLKKLTELAELFETSMDELLGTSSPATRNNEFNNEELYSYAYNVAQSQIDAYKNKNKIKSIITSVSIIILSIALVITNITIVQSTNDLRDLIENVRASTQVVYQDNEDDSPIENATTVRVTKVDDAYPNVAQVTFTYKPTTYIKGTKVKFYVSDMSSSQFGNNSFETEQTNGSFSATVDVNFAGFNTASIEVDDGTSITTEKLDIDWAVLYRDFTDYFIDYRAYASGSGKNVRVEFISGSIRWALNDCMPNVAEAYVEAKYGDRVVKSEPLPILTDDIYSSVTPMNFNFNIEENSFYNERLELNIKLIDEYNNKYYIDAINIENEHDNSILIVFANGGRLYSEGNAVSTEEQEF